MMNHFIRISRKSRTPASAHPPTSRSPRMRCELKAGSQPDEEVGAHGAENSESNGPPTAALDAVAPAYDQQSSYGSRDDYWEKRYQAAAPTKDWYGAWDCFGESLMAALSHQHGLRLLHVGNGTSVLPEGLHAAGYSNQWATDISPSVIATMRERTANITGLHWAAEDALSMPHHADGSFDAVVDKGTFDALACSGQGHRLIAEAARVIAPGGVYIMISSLESARRAFSARDVWLNVETTHVVEPGGEGFVHIATRTGATSVERASEAD